MRKFINSGGPALTPGLEQHHSCVTAALPPHRSSLYLLRGGCTPESRGWGLPGLYFKVVCFYFFWRVIPQGRFWLRQSGLEPKDIIWWTLWCGDSPSACLWEHPKFTRVTLRLFQKAGKILSQGCFSGSLALSKCSWLTDPTLKGIWALSSGFLSMQSVRFQVGVNHGVSVTHLIHEGDTENQSKWEYFFNPMRTVCRVSVLVLSLPLLRPQKLYGVVSSIAGSNEMSLC